MSRRYSASLAWGPCTAIPRVRTGHWSGRRSCTEYGLPAAAPIPAARQIRGRTSAGNPYYACGDGHVAPPQPRFGSPPAETAARCLCPKSRPPWNLRTLEAPLESLDLASLHGRLRTNQISQQPIQPCLSRRPRASRWAMFPSSRAKSRTNRPTEPEFDHEAHTSTDSRVLSGHFAGSPQRHCGSEATMILTPPRGTQAGYVPIATRQELAGAASHPNDQEKARQ